jgi:SP family myo-inositol transporter-like MFS transporter 13
MYYGPKLLQTFGFGNGEGLNEALIDALPLAFINAAGTLVAIFFVDRLGRRYILLRTLPGVGISLIIVAIGLGLNSYGKDITEGKNREYF